MDQQQPPEILHWARGHRRSKLITNTLTASFLLFLTTSHHGLLYLGLKNHTIVFASCTLQMAYTHSRSSSVTYYTFFRSVSYVSLISVQSDMKNKSKFLSAFRNTSTHIKLQKFMTVVMCVQWDIKIRSEATRHLVEHIKMTIDVQITWNVGISSS